MNIFSWILRIIAGSFLMVWLPMAGFASTPGAFVVSPAEVDLGTVRVLAGASAGPYAFSIAVVGGPVADADSDEEAVFFASSDASWLILDSASGTAPGSITATATVSETMSSGVWTANVTIVSGLDPDTEPVTIPVTITVIRSIGDLLTVSPSTLDLQMTDQNASQQTFSITIANADPNNSTDFIWSAQADVNWLVLSTDEGSGNSTVSLMVNPDAIDLNNDTDGDGMPDAAYAVGTITFYSNLNTEPTTLTVSATILSSPSSDAPLVTPGEFIVSPAEVNLGTLRLLPGSSAGPYDFNIAVVGGPVSEMEEAGFYASCDASWVTLDSAEGTAPGSITATATVSETMSSGVWTANVTIMSGLDTSTEPVTIPVTITVIRSIGDLLTVSPTTLDLQMTSENASEQTFPVTIANADPNNPIDFTWSAQTDVSWLVLSANEGSGNTTVSLRVDPDAMYVNNDTDGDGIPDTAVGTVTFRSSLNTEAITLTVNTIILSSTEPSVSPSQLYWTVEKSSADTALTFSSQQLHVFGFESGWTATIDMGFTSIVLYDSTGKYSNILGSVIITDACGWVQVTPEAEILSAMDYGTYTGYITVSGLDGESQVRIPITINIREPGEAVYLPVPEFINAYSMMDAAESSLINVQIPVSEDLAYYSTAATCQAAGGTWMDPDNTLLDSLDAYCSLNQHAYVLLKRQDMDPGMVYAMTKTGELALAYENGIKVSGADDLSYADGPVSYIPFGPLQMIGSYGTVVVSVRTGTNLSSAVEAQRLEISLQALDGQWTVTEAYKGSYYVYDFAPLTISRTDGLSGYTASWEDMPVTVSIGDGSTWLYQLSFEQSGINYTYQIQSLSGNRMSGQWQYTWRNTSSDWETFEAQRQLLWQLSFP